MAEGTDTLPRARGVCPLLNGTGTVYDEGASHSAVRPGREGRGSALGTPATIHQPDSCLEF